MERIEGQAETTEPAPAPRRPGNPRWVKGGPSPNPKGRPRTGDSLAEAIRVEVDPRALARRVYSLAMGVDPAGNPLMIDHTTSLRAADWLANHGYVKPAQRVEVTTNSAPDDAPLSPEERAEVMRLLREEERRDLEGASPTEH